MDKHLGVIFDDKLSLDSQIKNICKTSLFHLKNISSIRSFLPEKAAVQGTIVQTIFRKAANLVTFKTNL